MTQEFSTLGKSGGMWEGVFDTFPAPPHTVTTRYVSDEVTAVCPVTGQPDWYTIEILLTEAVRCLESKSLKLYLQHFRNRGIFCEALASQISVDVAEATQARETAVTVVQKPRGGVSIYATSEVQR